MRLLVLGGTVFLGAGLTYRPLAQTTSAALAHPRPPAIHFGVGAPPAGISREQELELLARWRRHSPAV
jgi:hypothetical protein